MPQVSISVALASWCRGDTSSMILWQLVQATLRASWELPCQKSLAPFVWQVRHTAERYSTGEADEPQHVGSHFGSLLALRAWPRGQTSVTLQQRSEKWQ